MVLTLALATIFAAFAAFAAIPPGVYAQTPDAPDPLPAATVATASDMPSDTITSLPPTPPPSASRPSAAPSTTDLQLQEGFVELRITEERGSAFYRVMVDEHENPFLDVEEVLGTWFEARTDCQQERRYCQATLPGGARTFWIDATSAQMGENGFTPTPIAPGALVTIEGRLWLRHDAWSAWLPVTTGWHLVSYILEMRPRFALLSDLRHQRDLALERQQEEQARVRRLENLPLTEPDRGRAEGRYRVQLERAPGGKQTRSVDVDAEADVARGTALVGANYFHRAQDEDARLNFWRYRRLYNSGPHLPDFYLLEVGDTRFDAMTLLSAVSLDSGVRIDRTYRDRGAGRFELRDRTQPGTQVDLYRNGFLEENLVVAADGTFEVTERLASGGDRFVLEFFFPDGSRDTRVITISWDHAALLDKGEVDWRTAAGETSVGGFAHAGVRYGFLPSLSGGLHALVLPDSQGSDNASGVLADFAWRPFYGLTILSDTLMSARGVDQGVSADFSSIPANTLRLTGRWLDDSSLVRGMPGQESIGTRLWRVEHNLRYRRLSLQDRYSDSSLSRDLDSRLDMHLFRQAGLFGETHRNGIGAIERRTDAAGVVITPRPALVGEGRRTWSSLGNDWRASLRVQGNWDTRWDAAMQVTVPDQGKTSWFALLNWRYRHNFHIGLTGSDSGAGFRLTWLDVVAPRPGPDRWDQFGTGTLSGTVYAPPTPGAQPQVVGGVTVRSGSLRAVSADDGSFVIRGIPADERTYITVDAATLDATVAPAEEGRAVRFRPGTRIDYNPVLSWTAGVDGFLRHKDAIPDGVHVVATRATDGVTVADVVVEPDGFFLIEGLTSGRFVLTVTGTDTPPSPMALDIPAGTDWIGGLTLDWPAPRR
ncbi:MAG: hypothetical protein OEW11_04515 [Nitrospirota bacterium]|nr:hypothetical protein [Nitrospirota bacterium]